MQQTVLLFNIKNDNFLLMFFFQVSKEVVLTSNHNKRIGQKVLPQAYLLCG